MKIFNLTKEHIETIVDMKNKDFNLKNIAPKIGCSPAYISRVYQSINGHEKSLSLLSENNRMVIFNYTNEKSIIKTTTKKELNKGILSEKECISYLKELGYKIYKTIEL